MLLAAFLLSVAPSATHAQSGSGSYYVLSLNADVDPGAANYVTSSISDAQSAGASHVVLVMNSFGGDAQSMDTVIQAISTYEASGGTFITLIGPYGANAFGAGSYISNTTSR